jgi:4a-hydroxytetrahydrobiopterin dehydratase
MSPFPAEDLQPLAADDVAVRSLVGWQAVDGRLRARYDTRTFAVGLALVNGIGAAAEAADHHPDIDLRYGHAVVVTWSHDVDAITARDVRLAREIDEIAHELGIPTGTTSTEM